MAGLDNVYKPLISNDFQIRNAAQTIQMTQMPVQVCTLNTYKCTRSAGQILAIIFCLATQPSPVSISAQTTCWVQLKVTLNCISNIYIVIESILVFCSVNRTIAPGSRFHILY